VAQRRGMRRAIVAVRPAARGDPSSDVDRWHRRPLEPHGCACRHPSRLTSPTPRPPAPTGSASAVRGPPGGIVTLTDSNARFRNPGGDRHMRFQCLTDAGRAALKVEIGENCPNVTSPSSLLRCTGAPSVPGQPVRDIVWGLRPKGPDERSSAPSHGHADEWILDTGT